MAQMLCWELLLELTEDFLIPGVTSVPFFCR